jgi:putative hydrolase of the HAD superfamily
MPPIWLFDLDNTLHHADAHCFPVIHAAMTDYMMRHLQLDHAAATRLRQHYWQRYGTTLTGLMREHRIRPHPFLHVTHPVPELLTGLVFEPALRHQLRRLPGQKYLFTNGPRHYARAVLQAMQLAPLFAGMFALEDLRYVPKPRPQAYRRVLHQLGWPAARCILVEDTLGNLHTAHALGMTTVWLTQQRHQPSYVDVKIQQISDLPRWWRSQSLFAARPGRPV